MGRTAPSWEGTESSLGLMFLSKVVIFLLPWAGGTISVKQNSAFPKYSDKC